MTITRKRITLITSGLAALVAGLAFAVAPAHADFTPRPAFSPVSRSPWIPPTTPSEPHASPPTPSNAVTPGPSASATPIVPTSAPANHCR